MKSFAGQDQPPPFVPPTIGQGQHQQQFDYKAGGWFEALTSAANLMAATQMPYYHLDEQVIYYLRAY